jgi:hypothetical protein
VHVKLAGLGFLRLSYPSSLTCGLRRGSRADTHYVAIRGAARRVPGHGLSRHGTGRAERSGPSERALNRMRVDDAQGTESGRSKSDLAILLARGTRASTGWAR